MKAVTTPSPHAANAQASATAVRAPAGAAEAASDAFSALLQGLAAAPQAAAGTPTQAAVAEEEDAAPAAGHKNAKAKEVPAGQPMPWPLAALVPPPALQAAAVARDAHGAAPQAKETSLAIAARASSLAADAPELADAGPAPAHATFQELLAALPASTASSAHEAAPSMTLPDPGVQALALPQPPAPAQHAPAPVHEAALTSAPTDPGFAGELAGEVHYMLEAGVHKAELRLHPADLGPIHIQLTVQGGTADLGFAAAHAATRDSLQQSLPALRDLLASQGLQLGQAGISGGNAGQSFAQPQQAPRDAAPRQGGPAPAPPASRTVTRTVLRPGRGMLDLYA